MEDIINYIDGKVQVIFERGQDNQIYRDAIWLSEAEYANTTPETLNQIKQQRSDNWLAIVNAPVQETNQ